MALAPSQPFHFTAHPATSPGSSPSLAPSPVDPALTAAAPAPSAPSPTLLSYSSLPIRRTGEPL